MASLAGCLGLLAAALASAGTPAGDVLRLDGVDGAAMAALRGDGEGARAMLRRVRQPERNPSVLVVSASLALEEGRVSEADRLARKARAVSPDAAEPKVLAALVAERGARPRGAWVPAAIAALRRVHPLKDAPRLIDLWDRFQDEWMAGRGTAPPPAALARLGPGDSFLVHWSWPSARRKPPPDLVEEAIRIAGSDERVLVLLAAHDVLEGARGNVAAAEARGALLERLRRTQPGAVRLLALQRPETDAVGEEDAAALEAALVGDDPAPFGLVYDELLGLLDRVDPAVAPGAAMGAAVTLLMARYHPAGLGMRLRVEPKPPEGVGRRLADALVRLADLQQGQGTVLTDMLAAVSLGQAAALTGSAALAARGEALRANGHSLTDASRCLQPLLRLPIASLQREWARGVPRERDLLAELRRLGLSCPEPELPADGKGLGPTGTPR